MSTDYSKESTAMQFMSDDEARESGLYLVIDAIGVPATETPTETAERAVRHVDELAAMTAKVLRDGFNKSRLEHMRDGLGELHVTFDMLAEDLRHRTDANEFPRGETADAAASLADELAALAELILREGFHWYRLADLMDGLGAIRDDFTRLARELRTAERGAA